MEPTKHAPSLAEAWPADLPRLRSMKRALKRRGGDAARRKARRDRFQQALAESIRLRAARRDKTPKVAFDADLPVVASKEEIAAAIANHRVVVVCGETGSGKSTQLPKICLAAGRGIDGVIGHTQPRRIAARSVASRIAEEIGSPLGQEVGYKVRFSDETSPYTYVKLMTDGILLAEAQGDPTFQRYDTIIIDEAHERSLNIDLLLGLLRRVVERRPEFRLVITSATIDAERFAKFFSTEDRPAPVIEVSGRGFPVEIRYRESSEAEEQQTDLAKQVANAIDQLQAERIGDTLVFLPTERDIRETARLLRGRRSDCDIVPLYARLSAKEQQRVFKPGKRRRIVLATNVAESSLTVPGIHAVVDTGTARIARYSARRRVQRLPIEPVSQASANQRAGRCGRVGPGVCVRLYSEDDYASRAPYTAPEIRRTNLAGTVLRLLALKLGDLADLPLLDRPRPDAMREARKTLFELKAIDEQGVVTPLGEKIGRMPVDPRVGRMIVAAEEEQCLAEVLIIAAAIETQDPRDRPAENQQAAEASHKRFVDTRSDFLGYLSLWDHLRQMRSDLSGSRFRKECVRQFLSVPKVLEWEDVHRQLLAMVKSLGMKVAPRGDKYGALHRALLTGLLSGVALRRGDEGYQSASGEGFQLWPGSGLKDVKPKWVVAAETVETSHRYLRCVAKIRPEWLPHLADHLAKKQYHGAHWSLKQQTVLAHEKLSLFDLPLTGRKSVPYGPIHPAASHAVFIQEALVDEGLQGDWDFLTHNREAVEQLRRLDAKLRLAAPLVDDRTLYDFYNERVPEEVYDLRSFRRWFRRAGSSDDRLLHLNAESYEQAAPQLDEAAFPNRLQTSGGELPIEYSHSRGSASDGMTLVVPADLAATLDARAIDWAVPGLLAERVVGLIRLLPKPLRTRLVPAPDAAGRVCERIPFGEGDFAATVAEALSHEAATQILASDLRPAELPDHLRMNLRVEDKDGDCVIESRDLGEVRQQLGVGGPNRSRFVPDEQWNKPPATAWTFGDLPPKVTVVRGVHKLQAYPSLLDMGGAVEPRLFAEREDADNALRRAVQRLFFLAARTDLLTQVQWLPDWDQLSAALKQYDRRRDYSREMAELLASRALAETPHMPRNAEAFETVQQSAREAIACAAQDITKPVLSLFRALLAAYERMPRATFGGGEPAITDIQEQLATLTPQGFLMDVRWSQLQNYPRYLRAVSERLRRIAEGGIAQDTKMHQRVQPHVERLQELMDSASGSIAQAEVNKFRWMIEEYRVSVFAQQLGTAEKVSDKRLEQQWSCCRQ